MIIDCISDLHGFYPELEGGDLLILAGDYTDNDRVPSWCSLFEWLSRQQYRKKVLIGGNHDNFLTQCIPTEEARQLIGMDADDFEYLCDSGTEFAGLKVWGSPWTRTFPGINPNCKAFTFDLEIQMREKFALIPEDTDILITHSPPYGILDGVSDYMGVRHCGSTSLEYRLGQVLPRLHVFGHIHEHGGKQENYWDNGSYTTVCVNASIMDRVYDPVHKPVRIVLP